MVGVKARCSKSLASCEMSACFPVLGSVFLLNFVVFLLILILIIIIIIISISISISITMTIINNITIIININVFLFPPHCLVSLAGIILWPHQVSAAPSMKFGVFDVILPTICCAKRCNKDGACARTLDTLDIVLFRLSKWKKWNMTTWTCCTILQSWFASQSTSGCCPLHASKRPDGIANICEHW